MRKRWKVGGGNGRKAGKIGEKRGRCEAAGEIEGRGERLEEGMKDRMMTGKM